MWIAFVHRGNQITYACKMLTFAIQRLEYLHFTYVWWANSNSLHGYIYASKVQLFYIRRSYKLYVHCEACSNLYELHFATYSLVHSYKWIILI